jgi:hypothetical protein
MPSGCGETYRQLSILSSESFLLGPQVGRLRAGAKTDHGSGGASVTGDRIEISGVGKEIERGHQSPEGSSFESSGYD